MLTSQIFFKFSFLCFIKLYVVLHSADLNMQIINLVCTSKANDTSTWHVIFCLDHSIGVPFVLSLYVLYVHCGLLYKEFITFESQNVTKSSLLYLSVVYDSYFCGIFLFSVSLIPTVFPYLINGPI